MGLRLICGAWHGNLVHALSVVCYYIKQNHKAYLSHANRRYCSL